MTMVLILDGNLEIGAHDKGILCYRIWLRHWIKSRAVTNRKFFFKIINSYVYCNDV